MQLIHDLSQGLKTIEPFLKSYGFELDEYEIMKDEDGHFTFATYKKEPKKFLIDYRFSIGQVLYQSDNAIVSHHFYLDHLGYGELKKHHAFLLENSSEELKFILHDFQYLVDDFFEGSCFKLVEFSKLHENILNKFDKKNWKENSIHFDKSRIEKARQEFRNKNFKKSMTIYKDVENKNLLIELDHKIIEFCSRKV